MNRKITICFLLTVALILGGSAFYAYNRFNDGFRIGNIAIKLPFKEEWQTRSLTAEEKKLLDEALNQPYDYLDKGHQAYVFSSKDNQYVIKLLKFQRVRIPEWYRNTPLPFSLEEWRVKRIAKKDRKLNSLLLSWKLGFDFLKEEAALLYVHINPTEDLHKKLLIRDKIGFTHELDLDQTIFLLQRKAPLLGPSIDRVIEEGREEEARAILDRIIGLLVSEYQRGLAEKELYMMRNTGVWQGNPIHIDTGRFEWDHSLMEKEKYKPELKRKTAKLREWLAENHPDLAFYFEQQIEKI